MTVNVKTENVTDATIQVHIAFENASSAYQKPNRKRATRKFNNAGYRHEHHKQVRTGRNRARHRSTTKYKRGMNNMKLRQRQHQKALPAPNS